MNVTFAIPDPEEVRVFCCIKINVHLKFLRCINKNKTNCKLQLKKSIKFYYLHIFYILLYYLSVFNPL